MVTAGAGARGWEKEERLLMPPLCITEVLLQEVTGSRFPEALLR